MLKSPMIGKSQGISSGCTTRFSSYFHRAQRRANVVNLIQSWNKNDDGGHYEPLKLGVYFILVGGAIPILKNMKVNGKDYPIYEMENKKCLKPPTSMPFHYWVICSALAHILALKQGVTPGLPHRRGPATLPVFEPPSENKDEAERKSLN